MSHENIIQTHENRNTLARPLNILLVEDNDADAALFRKVIESCRFDADVRVVSNGETALDYLFGRGAFFSSTPPDFVLLDLNLPGRSGLEILTEIRNYTQFDNIPIFFLSSSSNQSDIRKATSLTDVAFLIKPKNFPDYELLINQLFEVELPRILPAYQLTIRERNAATVPTESLLRREHKAQVTAEEFRLLVEAVQDYAIFLLDPNGYILTWNDGAERLKGYNSNEILGKHFSIFYPKEVIDSDHPTYELMRAEKEGKYQEEGWRVKKDGTLFWADVTISKVVDKKGLHIGYSKVTRDLTKLKERELELKRTEETLKNSERRNRIVLETTFNAFVGMDDRGVITDWNRQAEAIFGWSRNEVLGRLLEDTIIPPKYRQAHRSGLQHFLKTGEGPILGRRIEMTAIHKNGQELPVELAVSAVRLNDTYFFTAFIHDISARKKAEAVIQEKERQIAVLAKFPSENPDPVLRISPDGKILYANASSKPILEVWESVRCIPDEMITLVCSIFEDRKIHHIEIKGSNNRTYCLAIVAFPNEGYLNIYGSDITPLRDAQIELRRINETLELQVHERTKELEESKSNLEQFACIASHDLQEPLRSITLYLQLLEKRIKSKLESEEKQYIDFAVEGALRMSQLITDLLSLARIGRTKENIRAVNFKISVSEAIANLKSMIDEHKAQITVSHLPTLPADPSQVVELFQNLIANAIKYRSQKRVEILISAAENSTEWIFAVTDNGIGISPDYVDCIFLPFRRLHADRQKYPGSGIGLATSRKIVERYRGRIWVESQQGSGSTFFFALPRA